jgi:hypothetical protein
MTSFKDARNLLLDSYNDGTTDEDEFFVLYEEHFPNNPEFPYEQYELFDMDAVDDTECKAEFRFRKTEIQLLAEALDIPKTFVCHQGTTAPRFFLPLCVLRLLCRVARHYHLG